MKRAVGYCRVSTEEQTKGTSLKHQQSKIKAYCKLMDMVLRDTIIDDGYTGRNLKRPGIQKLLKMVEKNEVDSIVVLRLDRIFRNTLDCLTSIKDWESKGVSFVSISESVDTSSPMGRFFLKILSSLAELESEMIGQRIKESLNHLKENGRVYGPLAYGWKRKGKKLVEDPEEQKVIRKVLMLDSEKKTKREIADHLNEAGYRTKKGRRWDWQSVNSILDREEVN
jgi:site-specific DNA recombinase